ncbi:MAG: sugar ABC transporter permease [Proteobacteria bacterium]|nr:sugar ABC transporter permease [Pseudomonadota bacterium]
MKKPKSIGAALATAVWDRGVGVAFLVPGLILLTVILVGPFMTTIGLSFTDLSYALPDRDGNFVGFDNYRRLMRDDPVFWQSVITTLQFVAVAVAVEFVLGFAVALLLSAHIRRRRVVLTLFLVPMMLAPVAVGLIWKLMLQGDFGMLTHYLRTVGLLGEQTAVFSDPDLALAAVILIDIWQWTPFVTLVMLAGLLSLPREPYEAAIMDGAGRFRIFRDITVPLLRPVIALVLLLRGIDAFKEFDKIYILTGGGPGTATELLSVYTWRVNFRDWDLGYGAVCAFMVYLVVLILSAACHTAMTYARGASGNEGRRG